MSDFLSQDQIDSLLSGGLDGIGANDSGDDTADTVDRYPALNSMFELFYTQAGSIISTVISKKIDFEPEDSQKADFESIRERIQAVVLSLSLSFKSGLSGSMYLVIQKKDVAILSDLMMMGDGSAEYNEDHKDAIGELFNQVMGAFCTAFGKKLGITISAGPVEVSEFDLDNSPFPPESMDMSVATLNLEGVDSSYTALLIPDDLSLQIAEKTPSAENSGNNDKIGLNMSELDDLSRVTSNFDGSDELGQFRETTLSGQSLEGPRENIDMLLDIELDVNIELGRSLLSIKRILELAPGSIVELERMAGEPVDLIVNNRVIAKGEVIVVDENFGIRIVSLVSPEDRIKSLR